MSARVVVLDAGAEIERHLSFEELGRIVIRTTSQNKVRLFSGTLFGVSLELDAADAAALAKQLVVAAAAIKDRTKETAC